LDANGILVLLMFLSFIGLLFTGFPIAFVLGGVGILFGAIGYLADLYLGTMTGLDFQTLGMIVNRLYKLMDNWLLVAVPMFIYMGLMLDRSGIAEDMMRAIQNLFGKVRGGLSVTVTIIGIILAASTGIIGASVVLMGLLSLPVMLNQGYSKTFSLGTICASGTLGILIPPSVMLVIMGDQLNLPVGDLFTGALLPGVILGVMYIVYILVYAYFKPNAAPLAEDRKPFRWTMIAEAIKTIIPPAILIVAVLGSIFAGVATVTEASGVGALGATLLAMYKRKLNYRMIREVVHGTFSTVAYIFSLFIGATCFALVMRLLGGDEFIEAALTGLPFGPYGIVVVVMGIVFILGFFLDWIEITLIILPLLAPVIGQLDIAVEGYGVVDNPALVWFTILVAVCLQTSFLTPPVGFALFYLKGVCPPEVKLIDIYKGVVPFVILQLAGLSLVVLFPELVTWLPSFVYK